MHVMRAPRTNNSQLFFAALRRSFASNWITWLSAFERRAADSAARRRRIAALVQPLSKELDMPADHASGRFALLLNGLSRKAYPLGTTAALSLLISTAAHAVQCLDTRTTAPMVLAQAVTVSSANACILDESNMRAASGSCQRSATPEPATGAPNLPAQQPASR
jgi:hypothetical protein